MSIEEIVSNIDARIAALQSDIQPLLDAKVALLNSPSPQPKATRPRPSKVQAAAEPGRTVNAKSTLRPRRSGAVRRARINPVPSGKLLAVLEGSDGLSSTALAKQTGGDAKQLRVLLKELADKGQVRKTGERSATRWHLITEEEQIAARAAEIEAQMKSAQTGTRRQTRTRAPRTA